MDKITIAFADDCIIQHRLLKTMIAGNPIFELLCCAYNGWDLLAKFEKLPAIPNVCILDMEMPVMDGINTAGYLFKLYPMVKVFGHTSSKDEDAKRQMIQNGVVTIIPKNDAGVLLSTVEQWWVGGIEYYKSIG